MQAPSGLAAASSKLATLPRTEVIQQYLEDNEALIQTINDTLNLGRAEATVQYQQQLQRNLMWLAAIADAPAAGPLPSQPPLSSPRRSPGAGAAAGDQGQATGAQLVAAADAQAAVHAAHLAGVRQPSGGAG